MRAKRRRSWWFFGSIRRKLTLFVVLLCLVLVGLFWFLSIQMLQPSYQDLIRSDLKKTLDTIVDILDTAQANGVVLLTTQEENGVVTNNFTPEVYAMLRAAQEDNTISLAGRCLDVSDSQMNNLLLSDQLELRCLLHQRHEVGPSPAGNTVVFGEAEPNGVLVTLIRNNVRNNGYYEYVLEDGQMVLGSTAANGQFIVILSANLERIPQAVSVLNQLLVPISIFLVALSIGCAWAFSSWFSKPIKQLTGATRQMAAGNYNIAVRIKGNDEVATLAANFNTMAKEVKRSIELQKEFFANVSHDLRTPLTLIKGYAETLRDITGDNAKTRNEQLTVIVDETDRLSRLVNSVMEYSRISSGVEKPSLDVFNISRLYGEVGARYNTYCQQKGLLFDYVGVDNCYVNADVSQMERALHNLLGNALNHVGPDGYIGLHLSKTANGNLRVEISDHGPGIPPEDVSHLYDRYYRSRSDAGKTGTGLGLAITKAIFVGNGCTFGVESELGKGSVFWFEMPLVDKKKQAKAEEEHTAEPEAAYPIQVPEEIVLHSSAVNETPEQPLYAAGQHKAYGQIEAPEPICFNFSQMCDEVAYPYAEQLQAQGGRLNIEIDKDYYVVADPIHMQRVLEILLDNAMQYTGPEAYVGLRLSQPHAEGVLVEVTDNGPGVPETEVPLLFNHYDRSRTGDGRTGNGLGLTMAKDVFEAGNYQYGAYSQPGQGMVFWFEIPLAPAEQPAANDEVPVPQLPPNAVHFNLYQMCDEIGYDYEMECAQNGKQFSLSGDEECEIVADPTQIETILNTLLGYASRHVGNDGYLGVKVQKTAGHTARVEVIHHAPNMLQEVIDSLFTTPQDGLDLPAAKEILLANQYAFGVLVSDEEGTRLWFEVPLA